MKFRYFRATHKAAERANYPEGCVIAIEESSLSFHKEWLDEFFEPLTELNPMSEGLNEPRPKNLEL